MTIKIGSWLYDTDRGVLFRIVRLDRGVDLEAVARWNRETKEFNSLRDRYIPTGVLNKVMRIEGDRSDNFRNVVQCST